MHALDNISDMFLTIPVKSYPTDPSLVYRSCCTSPVLIFTRDGPFEFYIVKKITEQSEQDIRSAMTDCGIDDNKQHMFLAQMKSLNCGFVLAKYMPVENLIREFLHEYGMDDSNLIKELATSVQSELTSLKYKAVMELPDFKNMLAKWKQKYNPYT